MFSNFETKRVVIRPDTAPWLPRSSADRDDAAERAFDSGDGRHSFVIYPVLEINEYTMVGVDVPEHECGRPLRVVRLHSDERCVERHSLVLQLVNVNRLRVGEVLVFLRLDNQAIGLDLLDVLPPLIDQRDIVPRLRQ